MIDTARFRIEEALPKNLLARWTRTYDPNKNWYVFTKKMDAPQGNKVSLTYYPQDLNMEERPLILVETSLPKFFYGNNVNMLKNTDKVLRDLNYFLREPLEKKVNLAKSELDRIDLCYNHYVGEYVDDFIKYLFTVEHPTKKTKPYYPTNGVQFYAKSNTLSFYNKYQESSLEFAIGILREELSLGTKYNVRRALGNVKKPAFITDFTPEVVEQILQKANDKLGVNDVVIADRTLAPKALVRKYGPEQGIRLYGYLCAVDVLDNKELVNQGISKQTISRNRKLIREANMAGQLNHQEVTLPNLTINLKSPVEG